jgi:hypothetical protein
MENTGFIEHFPPVSNAGAGQNLCRLATFYSRRERGSLYG